MEKEEYTLYNTVLITGASSGIGYELAKLFARDKFTMVIVSRDENKLHEVARELESLGAAKVHVIAKDLSVPGSPAEVYKTTKELNLTIDILVNDAGVGEHGLFIETDLEKELSIIQLNIASLVHLTKLYLREMISRNNGKILQLASVASYQPLPLMAVYAATKAFVLSFTDALINEIKDTSVTMTALIPRATDTDFFNKAGASDIKATDNLEDPKGVAEAGYEALMKGTHHAVAPGARKEVFMSNVLPNETVAEMGHKQMEKK